MLRSDMIGYAFLDELFPRFESRFDQINCALMRLLRFLARVDTIVKISCALLCSIKLCYALGNFEIADITLLLTQSRASKSLHLWLQDTMKAQDPFPDSEEDLMFVSLLYAYIRSHV
jgi:hypothetical protein